MPDIALHNRDSLHSATLRLTPLRHEKARYIVAEVHATTLRVAHPTEQEAVRRGATPHIVPEAVRRAVEVRRITPEVVHRIVRVLDHRVHRTVRAVAEIRVADSSTSINRTLYNSI